MTDTTDTPKPKGASDELRAVATKLLEQADELTRMGADAPAVATMLEIAGANLKRAATELRREDRERKRREKALTARKG